MHRQAPLGSFPPVEKKREISEKVIDKNVSFDDNVKIDRSVIME